MRAGLADGEGGTMAIFRLQIESVSRDDGHGAVAAAAYRAGEKLRDDRTNELHNFSRRKDVAHSEILLPAHLTGQNVDWARDRASLWNTVESTETRKNARVAKEIQVTLPFELPAERRLHLARTFSQEVADHYKVAVDLAVHDPKPAGDPRNYHAHLLLTTREVTPNGLGAKAGLEMSRAERVRLGLPNMSQEFTAIRERWATLTNEALKEANIEARVDHRSLADQGVDREPKPHIPFAAYKIEQAGKYSDVAASIRADYEVRVQERQARAPEAEKVRGPETVRGAEVDRGAEAGRSAEVRAVPAGDGIPKNMDDVRRQARENWLQIRAERMAKGAAPAQQPQHSRTPDDDHHM